MPPRINWNAYDREEEAIINDEFMTTAEKQRALQELARDAREEYREAQEREFRDEFGW